MKLECLRSELIQALVTVKSGVSVKSTLSVLEGILFRAEQNKLYLTGSNGEISIRTGINAEIEREGEVVLSSNLILEIMRKFSGETVYINVNENYQIKVESMMSSFTIKGLSAEEYPDFPMIDEDYEFEMNCAKFKNMIRGTLFSVAIAENIPVLTGVKLEIEDKEIRMITLDGYRFSLREDEIEQSIGEAVSVIVPGKSVTELDKLLSKAEGNLVIRFSKTQIFFEIGETILASRLLEGEFINYRHIIPSEKTTEIIVDRRLLLASGERAALLAREGKNNLVKLEITDDKIEMTSGAEIGDVKELIPIKKTGNDLRIAFNSKFLNEALRAIGDDEIRLEMTTSVGATVIKSLNEDNHYLYLILPVRISD